jgi:hypothetical protein
MVTLSLLWLPILLSAVFVFIASSIIHMVLPYHRNNYRKIADEDKVRAAIRGAAPAPGLYHMPYCTHKELGSAETKAKFTEGPVVLMTVFPNGPMNMGKFLGQWFVYCLLVAFFTAYLAAHSVTFGAHYRAVFRVTGTAAFMAYGVGLLANGIWKGQPWSVVLKETFDGLIYALVTAGTFGWLWPR